MADIVEKLLFENLTNRAVHVTLKVTDEGLCWHLHRDYLAGALTVGPNQFASFPVTEKMCAKLRTLVDETGKPPMTIQNDLGHSIEFQFGRVDGRPEERVLRIHDRSN